MPWKIHDAEFEPGNPFIHHTDPKVDLHMVTSMANGTVQVYIGHIEPDKARFLIRISDDGAEVMRAKDWTRKDLLIMDSVLETMGAKEHTRKKLLNAYHAKLDNQQKAGPIIERLVTRQG